MWVKPQARGEFRLAGREGPWGLYLQPRSQAGHALPDVHHVHQGAASETDLGGKPEKKEVFYSSHGLGSPFLA